MIGHILKFFIELPCFVVLACGGSIYEVRHYIAEDHTTIKYRFLGEELAQEWFQVTKAGGFEDYPLDPVQDRVTFHKVSWYR